MNSLKMLLKHEFIWLHKMHFTSHTFPVYVQNAYTQLYILFVIDAKDTLMRSRIGLNSGIMSLSSSNNKRSQTQNIDTKNALNEFPLIRQKSRNRKKVCDNAHWSTIYTKIPCFCSYRMLWSYRWSYSCLLFVLSMLLNTCIVHSAWREM